MSRKTEILSIEISPKIKRALDRFSYVTAQTRDEVIDRLVVAEMGRAEMGQSALAASKSWSLPKPDGSIEILGYMDAAQAKRMPTRIIPVDTRKFKHVGTRR